MYVSYHRDSLTSDNVTEIAVSLGFSAVVIEKERVCAKCLRPVLRSRELPGTAGCPCPHRGAARLVAFDWVKGGFEATDIRFLELGSRAASHYDDF